MSSVPNSISWAIECQGVTKAFGNHLALRGVDLTVSQGESLVILGPNGAGKTTLVKVLATIMRASSGTIKFDGLNLKDNSGEIRRRIGVVTHQTYLYGNLTIFENLEFYARLYDIPRIRERIQEVVEMVGMTSRLYDRVDTLSRGMQQRISIARSLLHKPAVILLDEPETGLDIQATSLLWKVLKTEGEAKRTVILTTHRMRSGFEICDRVAILVKGKVAFCQPKNNLNLAGLQEAYQGCVEVSI